MIRTFTKLNTTTSKIIHSVNNKYEITPYIDIINTIKYVIETDETKIVENRFTKRQFGSSFVHISKTCLENSQEFIEFQKNNSNININIKYYPSMFNDKYGVQFCLKQKKIDIYLD